MSKLDKEKSTEKIKENPVLITLLKKSWFATNSSEEIKQEIKSYLDKNPNNPLALCLYQRNLSGKGLEYLLKALDVNPKFSLPYYQLINTASIALKKHLNIREIYEMASPHQVPFKNPMLRADFYYY